MHQTVLVAKKVGLKLGVSATSNKNKQSATNLLDRSGVFGGNDDSVTVKARAIIPIDYTGLKIVVEGVVEGVVVVIVVERVVAVYVQHSIVSFSINMNI